MERGATGCRSGGKEHSERLTKSRLVLYTEKASYKHTALLSYTMHHGSTRKHSFFHHLSYVPPSLNTLTYPPAQLG